MLDYKVYTKRLFLMFAILLMVTVSYVYYFSKYYPLPVTSRISFDAKIKFIREHIDTKMIDTIVVGSSIGLNDVQGPYLEKASSEVAHVLNLSVYEASPVQVEQLLALVDAFPHLKRVIYSVQFSDFQHTTHFQNYHPKVLKKYMAHSLNPMQTFKVLFDASKDLPFLIHRQKEWAHKHGRNNDFSYLGFDHTGSVPLHIYGKDIIQSRWKNPHGSRHLPEAFNALDRMSKKMQEEGIYFYFVQQPYRQALIKKYPHVPAELNWFLDKATKIVQKNGGFVFSLYKELPLDDRYFADRSHLNDKGSILAAEAIGKFIDTHEK